MLSRTLACVLDLTLSTQRRRMAAEAKLQRRWGNEGGRTKRANAEDGPFMLSLTLSRTLHISALPVKKPRASTKTEVRRALAVAV